MSEWVGEWALKGHKRSSHKHISSSSSSLSTSHSLDLSTSQPLDLSTSRPLDLSTSLFLLSVALQEDEILVRLFEEHRNDDDPVDGIIASDALPENKLTRSRILARLRKLGIYQRQKFKSAAV